MRGMNILFITASRIGDAVLSTGLLAHIQQHYPQAQVTIACGPLAVSLFEGYPLLARLIPLKKQSYNRHWFKLWRACIGTRWDMVVDLRNSAVSRLLRAKRRFIYGRSVDKRLHKVEQNAAVMQLSPAPDPQLWFTAAQKDKARALMGLAQDKRRVIGIGPASNWQGKTWPVERFIALVQWLAEADGVFADARLAVFGAPGEEDICQSLLAALPQDRRIDLIAKGSPGEAAAMLAQCDFYLGNDSGLMHAAAACGVATFGLFGPSYPHIYRPWGAHCAYVQTPESFDELIAYPGYTPQSAPCLMESLSVEAVQEKLAVFLKAQGLV